MRLWFERFHEFYRTTYLKDHAAPLNRWVHFLSNVSAVACLSTSAILWSRDLFLLGVWFQLGPPYLGHILFEGSHNSIDRSWMMSAIGSWYTTLQIVTGRQSITHGVRVPSTTAVAAVPVARNDATPATRTTTESKADDRTELLELLRLHGRNLHSFMVLEPGLSVWFDPARTAAVAYARRGGYWVAAGSPLCAAERVAEVSRAFTDAARADGRRPAFFGVSQRFVERLVAPVAPLPTGTHGEHRREYDALQIGLQPSWNPAAWDDGVAHADKLRNRIKRAAKLGVRIRLAGLDEVRDESGPLRTQMAQLVERWTAARALPPMGFMVTLELFQHAAERRYFVAEMDDGRAVGFAVAVPVYARDGWLVEDMVVGREAPAGTSEALVDALMRRLADEGAALVSLGMVALAGLDAPAAAPSVGRTHPFLTALLRAAARFMGWLYGFEGLYRFRAKMKPQRWEPVYLVAPGRVSWMTIRAVLMAFAEGWVPRFGLRTLGRLVARRWRP